MASRSELQSTLESIMAELEYGDEVYFQPPASVQISYPAIVYRLENIKSKFANDKLYLGRKAYSITVIDKNPDSDIPDKILNLPLCSFSRFFISDHLNHWNFVLYF